MSLGKFNSIMDREIYTDLLRVFIRHGDDVYILSPIDSKDGTSEVINENKSMIIKVMTGRIQKTNIIEKGINTVLLENRYKKAIKTYLSNIKFNLILFPTPPITLAGAVEYVKKRDKASTYLMLKDIFPQNAVDIGLISENGLKGMIYKYFRMKEKKLYALSDHIGCMSPANVEYVIKHNPEVNLDRVEVCPNAIEILDKRINENTRISIRNKYNIPLSKKVFVYGGNLGKPQGISFLMDCLQRCKNMDNAYFLIVGDGVEYSRLEEFIKTGKFVNTKLLKRLPKEEYDAMIAACDVGLVFLDYRFTIPNFPSRLLAYAQAGLPILAATDSNTDIGKIIVDGRFGWWCESNKTKDFQKIIETAIATDLKQMGKNSFQYLEENYSSERCYEIIMRSLNGDK